MPTLIGAFTVGFLSFLSPCVLPLVPGYLSAVSGVSLLDAAAVRANRLRIIGRAGIFCLSFSSIFIVLGLTANELGSLVGQNRQLLNEIAGVVIIALGVLFLLSAIFPALSREWHSAKLLSFASRGGPVVSGAAFALAWTPCVGPTLGAILSAASIQSTLISSLALLVAYSAGMAIPFLITAAAYSRVWSVFQFVRNQFVWTAIVSGTILIAMGLLIFFDEFNRLNTGFGWLLREIGLSDPGQL